MTYPRYTDPRNDPRNYDPVLRDDEGGAGGAWAWIAGLSILALIAFVVVAGWHSDRQTASASSPVTTSSAPPRAMPPSTTGSGATSPQPATPAPATPAPAKPAQ